MLDMKVGKKKRTVFILSCGYLLEVIINFRLFEFLSFFEIW